MTPVQIIAEAQRTLAEFLPPDSGISEKDCINQLLAILDGPDAVALTRDSKKDAIQQLAHEISQAMAAAAKQESDKDARIAALQAELARVRKHETHLIEARDALLKRSADVHKAVSQVLSML